MKVVVNRCFGGFGLSDKATEMLMNRKGLDCFRYKGDWTNDEFFRCDSGDHWLVYYMTKDMGERFSRDDFPEDAHWYSNNIERTDQDLIAVVEELGEEASGDLAEIVIIEIPDDVNWEINDYDGYETIHEVHRSW